MLAYRLGMKISAKRSQNQLKRKKAEENTHTHTFFSDAANLPDLFSAAPVVIRPRFLKPIEAEKVRTPEHTSSE